MEPAAANVLAFVRGLRRLGFQAGTAEVALALKAAALFDQPDHHVWHDVLAAVLVRSAEQAWIFELAFDQFFLMLKGTPDARMARQTFLANVARQREPGQTPQVLWSGAESGAADSERAVPVTTTAGASGAERLRHTDFAKLTDEEARALGRLEHSLTPRLYPSLRWQAAARGKRWSLTATLRRGMIAGEPLRIWRSRRATRQRPAVVLIDISGSMAPYARMALQFFHTILRQRYPAEVLVFSTRLTRITPALRHYHADRALAEVSARTPDYAGGTRLTEALHTFQRDWAGRLMRPGADLILLTDGFDASPSREQLAWYVNRLRRRAHGLIWWNPLGDRPGYVPAASGPRVLAGAADGVRVTANWAQLEAAWRAATLPRR
ncbi:MAG: VWA domain-containing protein [Thermaerobacter sp.]|nr:VWA domain-containing protein [Thermaerobacter sp.]